MKIISSLDLICYLIWTEFTTKPFNSNTDVEQLLSIVVVVTMVKIS